MTYSQTLKPDPTHTPTEWIYPNDPTNRQLYWIVNGKPVFNAYIRDQGTINRKIREAEEALNPPRWTPNVMSKKDIEYNRLMTFVWMALGMSVFFWLVT